MFDKHLILPNIDQISFSLTRCDETSFLLLPDNISCSLFKIISTFVFSRFLFHYSFLHSQLYCLLFGTRNYQQNMSV